MLRPPTPSGIAHIALTVSDLDRSVAWYSRLFGAEPLVRTTMLKGTEHEYRMAVWPELGLGLHHFDDHRPEAFSERRPGLDHLAFTCADIDELGIERSGVLDEPYGSGLAFRDPDDIALEFFVDAS
ncbi:MAG: VOC family protein [Actinomycetota bacterium]